MGNGSRYVQLGLALQAMQDMQDMQGMQDKRLPRRFRTQPLHTIRRTLLFAVEGQIRTDSQSSVSPRILL